MRGQYDVPLHDAIAMGGCSTATKPVFGPSRPQPSVILLSLDKQPWFDEMYRDLLSQLQAKAQSVREIISLAEALTALSATPPPTTTSILVTDAAIKYKKNAALKPAVSRFVRNGGTLIFMGHFASFMPPLEIKPLFGLFGLPWERGDYFRAVHLLNPSAQNLEVVRLPRESSQKSLCLHNVEPDHAVYLAAASASVSGETPVAFAAVGRGKVGYIGDVNAETEMNPVMLAMCGLSPHSRNGSAASLE